jgi:acetyltransferase-like isoleucine patch superfamily enzyme
MVSIHVVRVFAGAAFRSTPVWTLYVRLNGARVGRGVWINSLSLMDHNLLTLGDRVVIGSDVHIAAHIVERGVLTTAPVRLDADVTIGIGSVVEIGAHVGAGAQVGALSVVPKHATLEPGRTYVGAPVHALDARTGVPTPLSWP